VRSYLYVPADAPGKLAGALRRGADAVIVDLEDAVAPVAKDAARAAVREWLAGQAPDTGRIWVRINPGDLGHADARAVVSPALAGVCAAKTASASQIAALGTVIAEAEEALGLPVGKVAVAPLLETAGAVLNAAEIARAPRVTRLQLGEADLRAELGITPGVDERELLLVRSMAVLASAAAGIEPPIAAASLDFRDLDALRVSSEAFRRLGFCGRTCIHPAQIPVVNEVFTPSTQEIAAARDVVARFEAAIAAGAGVCLDAEGRMIDEAVVRTARRIIALAPAGC
jgi:citrate lyase subunit beta/citryl-CoA lyase